MKWDENFPYERTIPFANFPYYSVRHCTLQDVRSKININIYIPILYNHSKSFEGTMLVCYCTNLIPVRRDENNHMNVERIHPTQVSKPDQPGLYEQRSVSI